MSTHTHTHIVHHLIWSPFLSFTCSYIHLIFLSNLFLVSCVLGFFPFRPISSFYEYDSSIPQPSNHPCSLVPLHIHTHNVSALTIYLKLFETTFSFCRCENFNNFICIALSMHHRMVRILHVKKCCTIKVIFFEWNIAVCIQH